MYHVSCLHFSSSFTVFFCSFVFFLYSAGCKTSAISACKHWIFPFFPGCGDESKGVEVKIYENKTFFCFFVSYPPAPNSGHAKQNLQGVYKITSAPANVRPAVRGLTASSQCFEFFCFFLWGGLRSTLSDEVSPRSELTPQFCSVLKTQTPQNTPKCRNAQRC